MADREELVRELSAKYHIRGFEQSPLGREEASQFLSNLNDIKRRQHTETDRLQVKWASQNVSQHQKSHIGCRQRAGARTMSTTSKRENCIQTSRGSSRSDEPCVTAW